MGRAIKVRACRECNNHLGANPEINMITRRKILHEIYESEAEDRLRKSNGTKDNHEWK
jgi:hypothetical protein